MVRVVLDVGLVPPLHLGQQRRDLVTNGVINGLVVLITAITVIEGVIVIMVAFTVDFVTVIIRNVMNEGMDVTQRGRVCRGASDKHQHGEL